MEEMPDGSLRLSVEKSSEVSGGVVKVIDARGSTLEDAVRDLISAYIAGFDSIVVLHDEGDDSFSRKLVDICENRLTGIVAVQEKPGMVVFVVSKSRAVNLAKLIQRMVKNVVEIAEELAEGARGGDADKLRALHERDNTVDKIYFMATSMLSKALSGEIPLAEINIKSYSEIIPVYHAIKTLERISDHQCSASQTISRILSSGKKPPGETLDLIDETVEVEKKMLSAFIKLDVEQAKLIAIDSEKLRMKLERYLAEERDADLHSLILDFYRIVNYIIDIAETIIDINSIRELAHLKARYSLESSRASAEQ